MVLLKMLLFSWCIHWFWLPWLFEASKRHVVSLDLWATYVCKEIYVLVLNYTSINSKHGITSITSQLHFICSWISFQILLSHNYYIVFTLLVFKELKIRAKIIIYALFDSSVIKTSLPKITSSSYLPSLNILMKVRAIILSRSWMCHYLKPKEKPAYYNLNLPKLA